MQDKLTHNLEAEAAVIGCILIDDSKVKKVREILSSDDFYDDRHKWIFRAVEVLSDQGTEIDLLTLTDLLRNNGYLDLVGGASYLTEMTNYVPTSVRILNYAKIVAEDAAKRKIKFAAEEIGRASANGKSLEETLDIVKQQVHDVNKIGGKQNKYQVASMLDYVDGAQERYKNWGKLQGLSTGFPSIDELTLGLMGGELIIIAGPTSRGKTLLAMNISNNVSKKGGRVLFVTLEMTHEELTSRYMYANGGSDTNDFATVAANTIFQVNDELDWQDIDGLMQNAKEQLDVDLVVIDHLHYFTRELQNVAEDLGRITKEFKKNAKRYNIPVILISHIRKLAQGEELSGDSLRGSSLIAQDSDIVLMVNRDPETNQMGVMIDKNRNRGKLSDRTKEWAGRSEKELNTIFLDFNNTKLHDPMPEPSLQEIFPGSVMLPPEEQSLCYSKSMKLVVTGNVKAKKNNKTMAMNRKTGKMFPMTDKATTEYMKDAIFQLRTQFAGNKITGYPISVQMVFYYQTKHRKDIDNSMSTILDCMKTAEIIEDDDCEHVNELYAFFGGYDKENPRVEIILED